MKLIIITPEVLFDGEVMAINRLFAEGLETLHLRKPASEESDIQVMLDKINPAFHSRIVLHDHFQHIEKYNLKGVHLNRRNSIPPAGREFSVSKSCHSMSELTQAKQLDYVFLSPIFDSISKYGYSKAFTAEELNDAHQNGLINNKVYALGGISVNRIAQVAHYGFGGAVVLGALWVDFQQTKDMKALISRFRALQNVCGTYTGIEPIRGCNI